MRVRWACVAMVGLSLVLPACASNQERGERPIRRLRRGSAQRQAVEGPDSIEILQLRPDHLGRPTRQTCPTRTMDRWPV